MVGITHTLQKNNIMGILTGKKGIIFGALNDKSIAWKAAEAAAREGAEIVLTNTAAAMRFGTTKELGEQLHAPVIAADATSVSDLEALVESAMAHFSGQFDFVLHSVGMSPNIRKSIPYENINYDLMGKTLDISALSWHKLLQVLYQKDAIRKGGSVVALSYIAADRVVSGYSDMADAKALLQSITRNFGHIFGKERGVRVNTISQSPTPTTAGKGIKDMDNLMDFSNKMSPLGNATADDCANYCVMMFSDFTRKVTMQNLFHDGGFSSMGMSLRAMNQYAKDLAPYEDENGKIIYG